MKRKELIAILILAALVGAVALLRLVHMPPTTQRPAPGHPRPPRNDHRGPARAESSAALFLHRHSPSKSYLPKEPEARTLFSAAERIFREALVAAYEPAPDRSLCEAAVVIYRRFIKRHKDEPAVEFARLRICQAYTLAERYAEAAREYDLFLEQHPESELRPVALLWSGHSHTHLGDRGLAHERFDEVVADARRFIARHQDGPSVELAHFRIAKALTLAERHAEAAREYDLLLERHPESEFRPMAVLWSGISHLRAGERDLARKRFREVIAEPNGAAELAHEARRRLEGMEAER